MKTQKTFDINGKSINKGIKSGFDAILHSTLKITDKFGKSILNVSLILAIVVCILFPISLIVLLILSVTTSYKVSIAQEIEEQPKRIELQ